MARIIQNALILLLIIFSLAKTQANLDDLDSTLNDTSDIITINRDPGIVPWPLGMGLEKPFPWYGIQGTWMTFDSDEMTFFIFNVAKRSTTGERQLVIRQVNSKTCQVIAAGVGIEQDKVVRGQMSGLNGVTFRLSLSAYSEKDTQRTAIDHESVVREVMLASMTVIDDKEVKTVVNTQIGRLTDKVVIKNCNVLPIQK